MSDDGMIILHADFVSLGAGFVIGLVMGVVALAIALVYIGERPSG